MMKKTPKTIFILFIFLILGGLFGYTVSSSLHSIDKSKSILKALKENCNCKEINQVLYATGIQYGKNGLSTEKGEYELIDCEFLSLKKEVERIQQILNNKIDNFNQVDLLEFDFINGKNSKTVIIKKGIIQ
ncbi:hypothetical protein DS884_07850 [Tenacibaculum sp. E3R01]|uniref:hypothetical protein n=1 Tax=Tenacibaculum sp. E3R01 TaxID=2267227 RepID=UPI000DEBCEFB|nr:hypothetical protein [Tenacibaculum sp. E3R01]RBW59637.1 hypothetical protein DS884_07850 [Tenacibaculum sp. E3R01]